MFIQLFLLVLYIISVMMFMATRSKFYPPAKKNKKIVVSTNEDDLKGSISSGIHQLATYCYDIKSVSLYLLGHIIKLKF